MTVTLHPLDELHARLERGEPFRPADADVVLAATDLVRIGILGDHARRRRTGETVTFGRVCVLERGALPGSRGEAGEVRIVGTPRSIDEAVLVVQAAVRLAEGVPVTGFELSELATLVGHDHLALADLAGRLRQEGLDSVAAVAVDLVGDVETAAEVVRAVRHGGLAALRIVVSEAPAGARLDILRRAASLARECGGFEAFAPLPRIDPVDEPATGFDDVKTVALARLICEDIPRIQVDWPLYGPKLAQVALTFGAADVDGVAAADDPALGARRSSGEDIRRQIRAASAVPAERDGLYRVRG